MNEQCISYFNENGQLVDSRVKKMRIDCENKNQLNPRIRERETEELLYDLTNEYCKLSSNLKKLNKVIEANPESVSDYHKSLWKEQASYMTSYKSVLVDRIKDVLENN